MKTLILNTLLAAAISVPTAGFADEPTATNVHAMDGACTREALNGYMRESFRQNIRNELSRGLQAQMRAVQAEVAAGRLTAVARDRLTPADQI